MPDTFYAASRPLFERLLAYGGGQDVTLPELTAVLDATNEEVARALYELVKRGLAMPHPLGTSYLVHP